MANRVDSGKGLVPRSDSKVAGAKRVGVELGDEDEVEPRKRIKIRDLESVCRAEGSNKRQCGGQFQCDDEKMSDVTEVPVTSDLDASRAGKGVRSRFPVAVDPIPESLDLSNDACSAKNKVQKGSQLLSMSSEEATSPRDQVTEVPKTSALDASQVGTSVRSTNPVVVNSIAKPLDLNTDVCVGGSSTVQNDSQQCSQISVKTRLPIDHVTEVPKTSDLDTSHEGTSMSGRIPLVVNLIPRLRDLNAGLCAASNMVQNGSQKSSQDQEKSTVFRDHGNPGNAKGNVLDLTAKGVSSSENQDPFYPYKNLNHLKSRDVSECGSCTGPVEEKDPMTVWKEMKENGFLSPTNGGLSKPKQPVAIPTPKQPVAIPTPKQQLGGVPISKQHGGIPMPKQRPKKIKNEEQKKKMERAKKEQVDRFAKIAAPSGLLNELNPGIINHVRNRKQVHSIIEALVRSERLEISRAENRQTVHQQSGTVDNRQDLDNMSKSWCPNTFFEDMQAQGYTILMKKPSLVQVDNCMEDYSIVNDSIGGGKSFASHPTHVSEEEALALKLSSSSVAPEEDIPLSSKEETTSYLSFKAATVASQWLELIQQDIQGRLTALQRSRKRVQNVVSTDLPLLLKKEFPCDKENESSTRKSSVDGLSSRACAEMHRARWGPRFDQMDKALSEEEEQLESWLNQVREMQVHCNRGLQLISWDSGIQALGKSENSTRPQMDSSQREVAVRAAAASIYATCNFILSANQSPCC